MLPGAVPPGQPGPAPPVPAAMPPQMPPPNPAVVPFPTPAAAPPQVPPAVPAAAPLPTPAAAPSQNPSTVPRQVPATDAPQPPTSAALHVTAAAVAPLQIPVAASSSKANAGNDGEGGTRDVEGDNSGGEEGGNDEEGGTESGERSCEGSGEESGEEGGEGSGEESGDGSGEELDDTHWRVKGIIAGRTRKGKKEYLLKLRGWEQEENLECCRELIEAFEEQRSDENSGPLRKKIKVEGVEGEVGSGGSTDVRGESAEEPSTTK